MGSFVCEWCAEGLSPDEIDTDATYPDDQIGGVTDTGGHICDGCAEAAEQDDESDED